MLLGISFEVWNPAGHSAECGNGLVHPPEDGSSAQLACRGGRCTIEPAKSPLQNILLNVALQSPMMETFNSVHFYVNDVRLRECCYNAVLTHLITYIVR